MLLVEVKSFPDWNLMPNEFSSLYFKTMQEKTSYLAYSVRCYYINILKLLSFVASFYILTGFKLMLTKSSG